MGFLKSLFGGTSNINAPEKNQNKSIGQVLVDEYKPFIADKESAREVALTVLWHGKTQFIDGPNGETIRASQSAIPLPQRLQSFSDIYYKEKGMTVNQEALHFTYQLTSTIDDQTIQIETIYLIAEAIVEKYDL